MQTVLQRYIPLAALALKLEEPPAQRVFDLNQVRTGIQIKPDPRPILCRAIWTDDLDRGRLAHSLGDRRMMSTTSDRFSAPAISKFKALTLSSTSGFMSNSKSSPLWLNAIPFQPIDRTEGPNLRTNIPRMNA